MVEPPWHTTEAVPQISKSHLLQMLLFKETVTLKWVLGQFTAHSENYEIGSYL